jgi:hypothetical protein
LLIVVPMLLVSCLQIAASERVGDISGGLGMVILCSGLIVALGLGYRIASLHDRASARTFHVETEKPPPWEDDLA